MREKIKAIFCFIVIFFISIIGIGSIDNKNNFSMIEQRKLTMFPDFTIESLFTDEYYTNLTNAFSDQLALKEKLTRLAYKIYPRRYFSSIVKGKNDQLYLPVQIIEDDSSYKKELESFVKNDLNPVIDQVQKNGVKFIFVSVPRKDMLMTEDLPKNYINNVDKYIEYTDIIKNNLDEEVKFIDIYDMFKDKSYEEKKIFYETDHHVNIFGAYEVFKNIVNIVNEDNYKINVNPLLYEYDVKKTNIKGSFNRKLGIEMNSNLEYLNLYPKNNKLKYKRYESGDYSDIPVFGIYPSYANAYMGSDMAETYVKTNIKNAPNIMYVGTSYTNILESLSVYKFSSMLSIDYRENQTGKSIAEYVNEYNIDYVVYIPSNSDVPYKLKQLRLQIGKK